uniref:Uncharacterized protein n=1 Tax=Arundo donax TaxID=35708 RepID=A0A0A9AF33_ARUDO
MPKVLCNIQWLIKKNMNNTPIRELSFHVKRNELSIYDGKYVW